MSRYNKFHLTEYVTSKKHPVFLCYFLGQFTTQRLQNLDNRNLGRNIADATNAALSHAPGEVKVGEFRQS